jgi:alkylation response protein AidB-like acyl-CoA dehydrogenase
MNERVTLGGLNRRNRGSGAIRRALDAYASADPSRQTAPYRDRVVRAWIAAEVLRLTSIRAEQLRSTGTPGPEGSIGKIMGGLVGQEIYDLCMALRGADATLIDHYDFVQPETVSESVSGNLTKAFLGIQAATIGGGTTDINRNLIAERVLGLPGEPRVDKGVPWSQVLRS